MSQKSKSSDTYALMFTPTIWHLVSRALTKCLIPSDRAANRHVDCKHSTARSATIFAISTKCITARCGALSGSPSACDVATAHCSNSATRTQASSKLSSSLTVNGSVAVDVSESETTSSIAKLQSIIWSCHDPRLNERRQLYAG